MKEYREYLKHILEETKYLIQTSQNISLEEFLNNETLRRAFARSLEIIGEAVKKLPVDIKQQYNEVEWKKMAGMRDRLIHDYFGVDYFLVWDVVKNKIPDLKEQVSNMLEKQKN